MSGLVLRGVAAAPGTAMGRVHRPAFAAVPLDVAPLDPAARPAAADQAAEALDRAAGELQDVAAGLRADGHSEEAEIVEAGVLMASDPGLRDAVAEGVLQRGRPATAAIVEATDSYAMLIAGLDDSLLAARADDVRSLGRRAAALALGAPKQPAGGGDVVLVADDLGPADVAEWCSRVSAIALAAGATTSHAAIVARSLGVPMVVGVGEGLADLTSGEEVVVDGGNGAVVVSPGAAAVSEARDAMRRRRREHARARAERDLPAVTRDGRELRVLVNAASAVEAVAGLDAGAQGAGLVRTELDFLDATAWPSEQQHLDSLVPVLAPLRGRTATVRVLDFGGDKTPPFLRGTPARGLRLLLHHPDALRTQLRAIVAAGRECDLRVLLPLVTSAMEVQWVRAALDEAVAATPGTRAPGLGAMIELPRAAAAAFALAMDCDFLSVGTNDLTAAALGADRFAARDLATHHPRVLRMIERSVQAAGAAGIPIEICGEAASDPVAMPLLVGLGVDELSVGAARVGIVRSWVRALRFDQTRDIAAAALTAADPHAVAELVEPLRGVLERLEAGDAVGEGGDGGAGVVPLGSQR